MSTDGKNLSGAENVNWLRKQFKIMKLVINEAQLAISQVRRLTETVDESLRAIPAGRSEGRTRGEDCGAPAPGGT